MCTKEKRYTLTPEQRDRAAQRYRDGERPGDIAISFGVSTAAICMLARRYGLPPQSPQFAPKTVGRLRHQKKIGQVLASRGWVTKYARQTEEIRLPDPIPEDTRSLTARIFGDPLPGRSALERRAQSES